MYEHGCLSRHQLFSNSNTNQRCLLMTFFFMLKTKPKCFSQVKVYRKWTIWQGESGRLFWRGVTFLLGGVFQWNFHQKFSLGLGASLHVQARQVLSPQRHRTPLRFTCEFGHFGLIFFLNSKWALWWKMLSKDFLVWKTTFQSIIGHKKSQTSFFFFWIEHQQLFLASFRLDWRDSFSFKTFLFHTSRLIKERSLFSKLSHEKFRLSKTFRPVLWAIDVGW